MEAGGRLGPCHIPRVGSSRAHVWLFVVGGGTGRRKTCPSERCWGYGTPIVGELYILRSHQLTCYSWYHSWTQPAPVLCISICCCLFLCPDHMHKILMTHSDSIFWFAIPGLPLKLKDLHTPSLLASFIRIDEIVLQFPTIPKPQSLNRFISH